MTTKEILSLIFTIESNACFLEDEKYHYAEYLDEVQGQLQDINQLLEEILEYLDKSKYKERW